MKLVLNTWVLALVEGLAETIALAEGLGDRPAPVPGHHQGGPDGHALRPHEGQADDRARLRAELPARARRQGRRPGRRRGRGGRPGPPAAGADPRPDGQGGRGRPRRGGPGRYVPGLVARAPHHRRLPERLHARRRARRSPKATRSPPRSTRSPPPATTTSSSPPATGTPPTTAPSRPRAARGPCTASPGRRARSCTRSSTGRRSTSIVDKGQAVDTDGYSGFEGTDLEELLRERGITQVTVVGLATDYCVKNTALDALRAGFAGHRGQHRGARRRGRSPATPRGRWPRCARPAA